MDWHSRSDLFYGLVLVRPLKNSSNEQFGGAYVTFWVRGDSIESALASLQRALEPDGWFVSSLESMKRACDYVDIEEEDEEGIEGRAIEADRVGISLRAFHTFPPTDETPA